MVSLSSRRPPVSQLLPTRLGLRELEAVEEQRAGLEALMVRDFHPGASTTAVPSGTDRTGRKGETSKAPNAEAAATVRETPASGARTRRKRRGPLPRPNELNVGWSSLLAEISSSARRVRVRKGGRVGDTFGAGGLEGSSPRSAATPQEGKSPSPQSLLKGPFAELASPRQEFLAERPPSFGEAEIRALEDMTEAEFQSMMLMLADGAENETAALEDEEDDEEFDEHEAEEDEELDDENCEAEDRVDEEVEDNFDAVAKENQTWMSYRIGEDKVPQSVLETLWRRAVDPKHCTEEVKPLAKVPRLNVTNRGVEQLLAVFDIQHWRQVNTNAKQMRVAREEAEKFPSLAEILNTIFGVAVPPKVLLSATAAESAKKSGRTGSKDTDKEVGEAENFEGEVRLEMLRETFPTTTAYKPGAKQVGRRDAFDEGQPWTRVPPLVLAVREGESITQKRQVHTSMHRAIESARAAGDDEDLRLEHLQEIIPASKRVHERCQRKVERMKNEFTRKKGQMSTRLIRRMRRLQIDFQEIQGAKTAAILALRNDTTNREGAVRYLKRHRHGTEKQRRRQHAQYTQQAECFTEYLRVLADPNRAPERGEIYISECFKHVLSAGLIVDDTYFFRCLELLAPEDFESVATVNCVAACCSAFGINLQSYWSFLRQRGLPLYRPRPRPDLVRHWEDWAQWAGVDLESVDESALLSALQSKTTSSTTCSPTVDAALAFGPVLPENDLFSADKEERRDPLTVVIEQTAMDAVLSRYSAERPPVGAGRSAASALNSQRREESPQKLPEELQQSTGGWSQGGETLPDSGSPAREDSPQAPPLVAARPPGVPPPRRRADPRRIRGAVRSMAQAAADTGSGGGTPGARPATMQPIVERPRLEMLP